MSKRLRLLTRALPLAAAALAPVTALAVTGTESLALSGGSLSISAPSAATISGSLSNASASGSLNTANWADATGSGSGWNGSVATTLFNLTGAWGTCVTTGGAACPNLGDPLGATTSGTYTGSSVAGAYYTVTITSCAYAAGGATYGFSWAGDEAGSGTKTVSTTVTTSSAIGTRGVTITWAVQATNRCYESVNDTYTIDVGNQVNTALTLNNGSGSITANAGTTSTAPVFENLTSAVNGVTGSPGTAGAAVPFITAAKNRGMGSYSVVPNATVAYDPGSWAQTYTATMTYTIATGP